ncbi:MAG: hypothetical protein DMF82_04300 [Acidobacteria bacterium]|nr:MAG: hypothetical protein DMF82_04300 [Acidobacteriota bacterium]
MGSGFIVDPLGTVVTSLHIVEGATAIRVKLASGLRGARHARLAIPINEARRLISSTAARPQ